jgi:hypothetical protein
MKFAQRDERSRIASLRGVHQLPLIHRSLIQ